MEEINPIILNEDNKEEERSLEFTKSKREKNVLIVDQEYLCYIE